MVQAGDLTKSAAPRPVRTLRSSGRHVMPGGRSAMKASSSVVPPYWNLGKGGMWGCRRKAVLAGVNLPAQKQDRDRQRRDSVQSMGGGSQWRAGGIGLKWANTLSLE